LAFHAAYSDFPAPDAQEVAYEDVPGFPMSIDEAASKDKLTPLPLPLCRLSDLVEILTSATETGRWLVTEGHGQSG
jgi:hypothetical protein